MCQLIESLKIYNKQILNIHYHNLRLNNSRAELFGSNDKIDLSVCVEIPDFIDEMTYKCRVIYSNEIENIEFEKYQKRKIQSLKLIVNNTISYSYKYTDRSLFSVLLENISEDDLLIVKNGKITDTSFSNIVFFDGYKWITPLHPLLKGTKRQQLLDNNLIFENEILVEDLQKFSKARLINAMIDLSESDDICIEKIRW